MKAKITTLDNTAAGEIELSETIFGLPMRGDIVQDIMKVVDSKVKAEGFELVFDKSGQGVSQVPVVLYSAPSMDFSDGIITQLNASAPKKAD